VSPHLRYRFQVMENVDNLRRVLVVVTDFVHFKRNPSLSFGPMV